MKTFLISTTSTMSYFFALCTLPVGLFAQIPVDYYIAKALANSPEIRLAEAEIARMKGESISASVWKNPELEVEWGKSRSRSLTSAARAKGHKWVYSVGQAIEFPGKRALRQAIAHKNIHMAELAFKQLKIETAAQIRLRLTNLSLTKLQMEATRDVEERSRILTEMLGNQPSMGKQSLLDRNMIELALIGFQIRVRKLYETYENQKIVLASLLQESLIIEGQLSEVEPIKLNADYDSLWQNVKNNSVALEIQEISYQQSIDRFQAAKIESYPDVTIRPFYEKSRLTDKETAVGIGFSIPLPLWGKNTGKIQSSKAEANKSEAAKLLVQREIESELKQAFSSYQLAYLQLQSIPLQSLKSWVDMADFADRQYRLGTVGVQAYLDMQEKYLDSIEAFANTIQSVNESALHISCLAGDVSLLGKQYK